MKTTTFALGAVCLFAAASANADPFASSRLYAGGTGTGTGTGTEDPNTAKYSWDDGTSENSVGLSGGGEIAVMNAFTVSAGSQNITSLQVAWGTPAFAGQSGLIGGETFSIYVWTGTPDGANQLRFEGTGTVAAGSIDTDVFQKVSISANVGDVGDSFFVGVSIDHAVGMFPMSLDQTASQLNSWIAGSSSPGGFDPNNIGGGIGVFQMDAIGLGGNWLIRANAVPAPATLALFGLAGFATTRKRRPAAKNNLSARRSLAYAG